MRPEPGSKLRSPLGSANSSLSSARGQDAAEPPRSLLQQMACQRDRAQALLPQLCSIDAGLYGQGKELIGLAGAAALRDTPPQSADQILQEISVILDQAEEIVGRVYIRL